MPPLPRCVSDRHWQIASSEMGFPHTLLVINQLGQIELVGLSWLDLLFYDVAKWWWVPLSLE
ncbi:hypothetical protein Pse7367_1264 [Thalassoporum mexicanum PCC 7367]|nr:hypothetical protein Pse7367_1264 [Pseudanabaena sp. PCC 7367]